MATLWREMDNDLPMERIMTQLFLNMLAATDLEYLLDDGDYWVLVRRSRTDFARIGLYIFFVHGQEDQLIQVKMQSRHRSGTEYNVWVKFDGPKVGLDGILGYTCNCPVSLRVVGAGCHVTSVSMFLINILT
jgi:hypothetical protein